ncbi:hypothetical protein [Sphingomicrobium sediminis]|uniref:Uncharacterized protein n=1 Tax=Sphingomicrobium sediminis TaxID=2950949 RepID=A0A9X2EH87_9SPHN|nr:hypothetical protein [Sphingomicrobium sediminis]MCM8557988.1 hypothetical protein [Sphingomicrobium sediminis]
MLNLFRTIAIATVVLAAVAAGMLTFRVPLTETAVDVMAKTRPELFANATVTDSAPEFHQRFPDGTYESELIEYLESEGFTIEVQANQLRKATLRIVRSDCGEEIDVSWYINAAGKIHNTSAYAEDSLCW